MKPVPVHALYRTAWVDQAGAVRKDLYGLDARLATALRDRRTARFALNPATVAAGP